MRVGVGVRIGIAPRRDGAAPREFQIARGADWPWIRISAGQSEQTQDGRPTGRAQATRKVRMMPAQRVRAWTVVPDRVRRAAPTRARQMGQQMLNLLPQCPVEPCRALERCN